MLHSSPYTLCWGSHWQGLSQSPPRYERSCCRYKSVFMCGSRTTVFPSSTTSCSKVLSMLSSQSVDGRYYTGLSGIWVRYLQIGQYNLPLWCSSLCMSIWQLMKWGGISTGRRQTGADFTCIPWPQGSLTPRCMCKMAHFIFLCTGLLPVLDADGRNVEWGWSPTVWWDNHRFGLCRRNISTQTDSWCHLQNWVNRIITFTSTIMEMEQLFHGELGEGAQTLHDSSAAAAQRLRYIMQKPPMLRSWHAEWYAVASHHWDGRERERKEGISQRASRLYLNCELNLERETGRNSKTKEGKKGSKSKGRRERKTYRREPTSSDRLRRYNSNNISMLRQWETGMANLAGMIQQEEYINIYM